MPALTLVASSTASAGGRVEAVAPSSVLTTVAGDWLVASVWLGFVADYDGGDPLATPDGWTRVGLRWVRRTYEARDWTFRRGWYGVCGLFVRLAPGVEQVRPVFTPGSGGPAWQARVCNRASKAAQPITVNGVAMADHHTASATSGASPNQRQRLERKTASSAARGGWWASARNCKGPCASDRDTQKNATCAVMAKPPAAWGVKKCSMATPTRAWAASDTMLPKAMMTEVDAKRYGCFTGPVLRLSRCSVAPGCVARPSLPCLGMACSPCLSFYERNLHKR